MHLRSPARLVPGGEAHTSDCVINLIAEHTVHNSMQHKLIPRLSPNTNWAVAWE